MFYKIEILSNKTDSSVWLKISVAVNMDFSFKHPFSLEKIVYI